VPVYDKTKEEEKIHPNPPLQRRELTAKDEITADVGLTEERHLSAHIMCR
jgi:hypothetical protein